MSPTVGTPVGQEVCETALAAVVGVCALAVLFGPLPVAVLGAIAYVALSSRRPLPGLICVILSQPSSS